jgi:phosphohistidine phosphatase
VDLILWRHAEAHPARDGQSDLERALTAKGERQAGRMAEWLNARLAHSTRVLASPARRCQQTVAALDRPFRTLPELAPDGTVDGLLAAARWPRGPEPVLVVGHQPILGLTASTLLAGAPMAWSVKKGAVWWLRLRDRDDEDGAAGRLLLHAVQSPDGL